jgi:hypothetical protein
MSLTNLDANRDIAESEIISKTNFEIVSATAAQIRNIVSFVPEASSSSFFVNAQGSTTVIPLSGAFRQISNYFFSSSAAAAIPVAHDSNSTTSLCRVLQVGRTTSDDAIVSGSITATCSFGTVSNLVFIDQPENSISASVGRKGSLVEKNDTSNVVGTVFYDSATMIFHGGDGDTNFIADSTSGFTFGPGATAGKIAINNLSFQAESRIKRSLFFCRAFNKEFNFTNNPTAIQDAALGTITSSLTANPTTYITSVGLYNEEGELLAVAKVSPPAKKTFDVEQAFSIRLQY